jgi:hypothetical protein
MFFGLIDSTDYAKEEIIVSSRFLYYTFIVNALRNKVPKWKTTSEKLDFNKQMVKIFKFNKHLPRLESYFSEFSKRRI